MRGILASVTVRGLARAAGRSVVITSCLALLSAQSLAQEEEYEDDSGSFESGDPVFEVNGMMKMQGGVFLPMPGEKFTEWKNEAYKPYSGTAVLNKNMPCDPVLQPTNVCYPVGHGQPAGSPSIARATFQLEAQWNINDKVGLHSIVRAVRSMKLPADEYARVPDPALDPALRKDYAEQWSHDNYYTEMDIRELYLDLTPKNWLSFRIGRQQVAWGDTGQYRLLDVVNPQNATWHFAPLEAIEDTRIPLWMWLTTIDMPKIDHSLELLYIPLIDRKRETVHTPASFTGAWGVPYSNYPTSFFVEHSQFKYPGQRLQDQRGGARWKGNLGAHTSYSLVYMYTHQMGPPIPDFVELTSSTSASRAVSIFPRQHIAGFTLEQLIDPLAMVARLEVALEPNRTYPGDTRDLNTATMVGNRYYFYRNQEFAANYAVVLQRPTMIRFLNPTQNFLLVAQFMHTFVPTLTDADVKTGHLREAPTFNEWTAQKHKLMVVGAARTNYLNGRITVGLTGAVIPNIYENTGYSNVRGNTITGELKNRGHSGFYSIDIGFRFGPHYRLNITATDFIGRDPYRDLGLFRDRDELHAALSVLF
jgi:hypothetical protein